MHLNAILRASVYVTLPAAIACAAAFAAPFLLWAVLAIAARKKIGLLYSIYPAIHVCCWITLLGCAAMALAGVFHIRWLPLYLAGFPSFGLQFVKGWVAGLINSDYHKEQPDGWWPAKREL